MNLDNRKYVLIGSVIFICAVFILRLFWIQVVDTSWTARAADISERKITVFPSRGLILDRHGELLVANTPVYDIMVVPREVKDLDTLGLSKLINVPMDEVRLRLRKASEYSVWKPSEFERQITADQYAAIAVHLYKYPGFYGQSRTLRTYPPHLGAHMLGYVSEVNARQVERDPYYKPGDVIGVTGLERYYEKDLRGKRGVKYVVVDVHNNVQGPYKGGRFDTTAYAGENLYTSIDAKVQALGEKLMKNKKGSIVALDPKTGEIIALVSSPNFDPELLVGRVRNTNYRKLQQDSLNPLFDRALQAQYPPGSIFKLAQAAIALQEGVITEHTGFPCNHALVGCHNHPSATTIEDGIKFSCNPYFYQVFKHEIEQGKSPNRFTDAALGLDEWQHYMTSFGFGTPPALDLPAVKGGSIPGVPYYNRIYGENAWAFSTIYSLSIGQGEVLVVPVQMADLAAIFANRGYYYDPHVVRAIGSPDSLNTHVQKHHTLVDDKWFPMVVEGMRRVVNEPGGTAHRAQIPGITVCGKTGTAQNPHGKDHAVFIAFAPMDDPKIAIAVYVENSGFGGTWAAPIASLCMEQYLTDTIARPAMVKEMEDANLIATEGHYTKYVSKTPQAMNRRENVTSNIDKPLVIIYLLLMAMGWANIYSAAYDPAHANLFDRAREYGAQSVWILVSLAIGASILLVRGDFIRDLAYPIYGFVLLLLILVLLVGREVNGARAWFGVGGFGIQPAEFSKFATALALTKYLSGLKTLKEMRSRVIAAGLILLPVVFIMLQPDTGTALVSGAFVLVLYREGLSGNILLLAILAAILAVLSLMMKESTFGIPFTGVEIHGQYFLIVLIAIFAFIAFLVTRNFVLKHSRKRIYAYLLFGFIGAAAFISSVDQIVDHMPMHQQTRIRVLLGLEYDPRGFGYNVEQSKTAIGSGGFAGKGYLQGTFTKYKYVPMQSTDFIFCTVGEEWGFLGTTFTVLLFGALILRCIYISGRQRSRFTRIYAYCVASIFFLHLMINVGMAIGLAPVIGIPLPFFSYGGSSLIDFTLLLSVLVRLDAERLSTLG